MAKPMIVNLSALLSGLVFGLGLIMAGMMDPAKVLAFLDVAGSWDPSLALVMAGAIAIGFVGFSYAKKQHVSFLGLPMVLPSATHVDKSLVIGSLVFGVGWGLTGICPGAAIVLAGASNSSGLVFLFAMLAGIGFYEVGRWAWIRE